MKTTQYLKQEKAIAFCDGGGMEELQRYTEEQDALTARFVARGVSRREYLERLILAVDGDLSATWGSAHERLSAIKGDDPEMTTNNDAETLTQFDGAARVQ